MITVMYYHSRNGVGCFVVALISSLHCGIFVVFSGHAHSVDSLSLHGHILASNSEETTIKVWDAIRENIVEKKKDPKT